MTLLAEVSLGVGFELSKAYAKSSVSFYSATLNYSPAVPAAMLPAMVMD